VHAVPHNSFMGTAGAAPAVCILSPLAPDTCLPSRSPFWARAFGPESPTLTPPMATPGSKDSFFGGVTEQGPRCR